ncbi:MULTISPECIES: hypothetical protein [unclassified Rhizobium]|uniref:hypothetical protein n=1 Tax=unclassified Rhizobium TaxID=2613769 RepID=UPI0016130099|nr:MULTISPECIES: hypothetical protein [unclassified Rhizobium]MBB3319340.1 hypothetical protein [Rhizobium sp. BK181]MBB3542917.1 hypothetical protein [Rhizobium sp. BK399]MCS3743019.1 hypothetical protein [Rhizobium sp. BK661]MCS4095010.1 hypothetical protein [Rhizobium sp. BK176]
MFVSSLVPGAFYWARSTGNAEGKPTVVQVSTVFGEDPEYWTFAVVGSEQHHMIGDFEIISLVEPPSMHQLRQAAE